jgi:two-component system, OmpR family, response regulator
MNKKVIVVDDDHEILALLSTYLKRNQYDVVACANGAEFEAEFERLKDQLSLVILDVMLPDTDGFQLCQIVRKQSNVPIFMLTANSEETDRIVGLEMGADDYIAKPFSPRELLARIKAVHRRFDIGQPAVSCRYLHFNHYILDTTARTLTIKPDGQAAELLDISGVDFQLLYYFTQHCGELLSRNVLSEHTRGRKVGPNDRFLDVQISRLRTKMHDDGSVIKTVRGAGYIFSADVIEKES